MSFNVSLRAHIVL